MLQDDFIAKFQTGLIQLKTEIESYPTEDSLWIVDADIKNSGGNLALHLIGNLNHFIGSAIGNTGYVRNRDLEFSDNGISKIKICNEIDLTLLMVKEVLSKLDDDDFKMIFPESKWPGKKVTTAFLLMHLLSHLFYHMGQINYHRRIFGI